MTANIKITKGSESRPARVQVINNGGTVLSDEVLQAGDSCERVISDSYIKITEVEDEESKGTNAGMDAKTDESKNEAGDKAE